MAYFVDSSYFEKYALSTLNANGALEAVSVLWGYGAHVSIVVDCFVVVVIGDFFLVSLSLARPLPFRFCFYFFLVLCHFFVLFLF